MDLPKRKTIRLPNYDYSSPGAYFVTVCTKDRRCLLSDITVGADAMKRLVSKEVGANIWQRSFHEHVIRGAEDYAMIWDYIEQNPAKWTEDRYYAE